MGAGYHGGFGNTYGAVAGDAVYKSEPLTYFEFISKRPLKDAGGLYDVVAHGESNAIQIEHNGVYRSLRLSRQNAGDVRIGRAYPSFGAWRWSPYEHLTQILENQRH